MDHLDDSENNAKISDSAYSNSCSNSQSRRSHSSKSTRSGSNSSGSSGYGGKPSAYSDNSGQPAEKRIKDKDLKKKKQVHVEQIAEEPEERPDEEPPAAETVSEETCNVARTPTPPQDEVEKESDIMEIASHDLSSTKDEVSSLKRDVSSVNTALYTSKHFGASKSATPCTDGFSCVISMHDGVVMYTTSSLTATLGFPKEMWIGRSFIDFVHPRDRNTFASHITSGLAVPKNVNGTLEEVPVSQNSACTMVCRIRKYRSLSTSYGVKERMVTFMPFFLKLSFKKISDEEGKVTYLVIQASPFFSAFETPNELVSKPVPFVIRHAANGNLEYIDPESVPYLGYLPQDLADKDALQLYHPEDLPYLRLVYETIVKEGGLPRSKPYRILAQNGDFIRVETEWSSFINPWSKKLEFVIGKHHIIEGPNNPDVFHPPVSEKGRKISEEEKNKINKLRESIVRIMNEVLTKPAEAAKQQMTKRCQDLASFMESLIEEQPKMEDELRLEIQEPDHSYYERDSVMLGGISPHHDHNDSKSSTETPLSYNQLNYNKTLERYFDSHQPFSYEDPNTDPACEEVLALKHDNDDTGDCMSPMGLNSRDSGEMSSSESGCMIGGNSNLALSVNNSTVRLTESLLNKHNTEMEKELLKIHRASRSSSKGEREVSKTTRQKKKEHLARCNAVYQPTSVINNIVKEQPHGLKRASKHMETEMGGHKHHCSDPRLPRRRQSTNAPAAQTSSTTVNENPTPANITSTPCPGSTLKGMNTFILGMGMGIPQQMPLMSTMAPMPGMIPMYYAPAVQPAAVATSFNMNNPTPSTSTQFQPTMQCMMYGQAMYGSPIMYSSMNPQMHQYTVTQNLLQQSMYNTTDRHPLGLARSNYEEACKQTIPVKTTYRAASNWREKKLRNLDHYTNELDSTADSSFSSQALNRSTEAIPNCTPSLSSKAKGSEETVDRTDGESSYSSFYSSFFRTESGSAEDSGDLKKQALGATKLHYEPPRMKTFAKRKMDPPWLEKECVTSELVYKYQILTRSMEEVLQADKMKMTKLEQPSLVNEQLGQLYLDLQLEGVAARLSLEEGITSSSSSGEETSSVTTKVRRRREYSKLAMIYEEDAPLPPLPQGDIPIITVTPSTSTAEPNS